jgi:hypothetical protein
MELFHDLCVFLTHTLNKVMFYFDNLYQHIFETLAPYHDPTLSNTCSLAPLFLLMYYFGSSSISLIIFQLFLYNIHEKNICRFVYQNDLIFVKKNKIK